MKIIIFLILVILIFEIVIFILINRFKKKFQWIVTKEDEYPLFSKNKLKNFYKNSFDPILGWDRKKNSSGREFAKRITKFNIEQKGHRKNKKLKKSLASVYGDSFAFCRYVNDDKTWESFLEKKIKNNIFNFGVGNYGLDQSFLKFVKKKDKNKIIIFNVVPETIARINSYWKHYREFGNIFAFKPIIKVINKKKIRLIKIKIKKNFTENQIHHQIDQIKKNDIYYKDKFFKDMYKIPYLISFLSKFKKNACIFFYLALNDLSKNNLYLAKAHSVILEENILDSHIMYNNEYYSSKLKNLITFMNYHVSKKKKKMILIITPQLIDLKFKSINHSINFYENLDENITCLDLTKDLLKLKNYKKFYLKDIYGGHLDERGNKLISNLIYKKLKIKKIL